MSRVKPPPGRLKLPRPFPCGSLGLSLDRCAFAPGWGGFVRRAIRPRWSRPVTQEKEITMSDGKTNEATASKAPSHVAYQVRDREGQKGFWTRIGSAWPHADGKGFNVQLDVVPLDGRITLRVATEKKD
jgi:hypothetical protein